MKLLYISIDGLRLYRNKLTVDFIARQRVTDLNQEGLDYLQGNIYKQNVLGFIGMNASGKTTILKWITCILDLYLKEGKLNDTSFENIFIDPEITVEAYFTDHAQVYKIKSELIRTEDENYIFKEEVLWQKNFIKSMTRNKLLDFTDNQIKLIRSEEANPFLADDMSIMISEAKKLKVKPQVMNLLDDTNINMMRVLGDVPAPIIQYLDPSVEYVKSELTKKGHHIRLKFKGTDEEIYVYNRMELFNYLSSGTIKGLNVFAAIRKGLETGGFVIIDEIENHFNQSIVRTIISLFKHEKINAKGATFIFSTHYAELLDDFERTDNLYITFKEETLEVKRLSELLKRTDFKKSEVYQSSYIGKTAPSYNAYMDLKRYFIKYQQASLMESSNG